MWHHFVIDEIREKYPDLVIEIPTQGVVRLEKDNKRLELYPKKQNYFFLTRNPTKQSRGTYENALVLIKHTLLKESKKTKKAYKYNPLTELKESDVQKIVRELRTHNIEPTPFVVLAISTRNGGKFLKKDELLELIKRA